MPRFAAADTIPSAAVNFLVDTINYEESYFSFILSHTGPDILF